jgi:hypothetical protein
MGATMPFSTYTVEPDLMEAMRAAFYRVCEALRLNCAMEDRLTEIIVTKIVELAKAGERDPQRLCISVLAEMQATGKGGRETVAGGMGAAGTSPPAGAS